MPYAPTRRLDQAEQRDFTSTVEPLLLDIQKQVAAGMANLGTIATGLQEQAQQGLESAVSNLRQQPAPPPPTPTPALGMGQDLSSPGYLSSSVPEAPSMPSPAPSVSPAAPAQPLPADDAGAAFALPSWGELTGQSAGAAQAQAQAPSGFTLPSFEDLVGIPEAARQTARQAGQAVASGVGSAVSALTAAPASDVKLASSTGPPSGPSDVNAYLEHAARRAGIDPAQVLAVMGKEGPTGWGSVGRFDTGTSYGPLQLHYAGGPNPKAGMGDRFTAATGIDLRKDTSIQAHQAAVDFAMGELLKRGDWSEWYGADNAFPAAQGGKGRFTPVARVAPVAVAAPRAASSGGGRVVPDATPNSYWTAGGTHGGAPAADIFAPEGAPIYAPVSGTSRPAVYPSGGNATIIAGDDGRHYYMAHGHVPFVGGRIEAGQQIGQVGRTGNARGTAPHLHYAIATNPGIFDQRNGSGDITGDAYWTTPAGDQGGAGASPGAMYAVPQPAAQPAPQPVQTIPAPPPIQLAPPVRDDWRSDAVQTSADPRVAQFSGGVTSDVGFSSGEPAPPPPPGPPVRDDYRSQQSVPFDPDQGPREALPGSVGATPYLGPLSPNPEPVAPPPPSPAPTQSTRYVPSYAPQAAQVMAPQAAAAPVPQLSPTVPSYAPQAAQVTAADVPTSDWAGAGRTIAGAAQAGVAAASEAATGTGAALAGMRPPETQEEVIWANLPAPARAGKLVSDTASAFGDAAARKVADALGYSAEPTLGTEAFDTPALGPIPSRHVPAVRFSPQDVAGVIGATVADPMNWVAPGSAADLAADAAIRGIAGAPFRAAGRAARVGANRFGAVLADNAQAVAAADARMAAQGSTTAPGVLGALPEPGGARRGVPTVEVLQEQLDTATAAWQRARASGDEPMAALAREQAVALESALVDARNARLDLEPAITSDIGRRVESLPLAEETADTLSGAGAARGALRPEDLSGPVGLPVDLSGRANASAGALPAARIGADRFGAVRADPYAIATRAIAEPLTGSMAGATIGAGLPAESDEERRQNALTGAGLGMVGFPAATRLARGAARLAGAAPSPGGGALASAGGLPEPPRAPRTPGLPEGALPIRLSEAEELARLKLGELPPEARDIVAASARQQDWMAAQRRGVLPDDAVAKLAYDDATTVDQHIQGSKAGKAYNAEQTVAIRNATASQAMVVRDLSEQIADARSAGMTPDLLLARRAAENTRLDGLVKLSEGAKAEAGRALRQYQQEIRLLELDPNAAIARIRAKITDPAEFSKIVDEYTEAVRAGQDPITMAKLWQKVEAGEFKTADAFNLYVRGNLLSGLRTLEVNFLSGGVNLAYEAASRAGAQVARGRFAEAGVEAAAIPSALGKAGTAFAETMRHGVSTAQALRTGGDIRAPVSATIDNPVGKRLAQTWEMPDRFNAAVDQMWRTFSDDWATTVVAHDRVRGRGLTPRSDGWAQSVSDEMEAIRANIHKETEVTQILDEITFSEDPGKLATSIEGFRRNHPILGGFLFRFVRTPANILSRSVDISPLGPVRTGIEAATGLGRGRERVGRRIRDNMVGVGLTAMAYGLAEGGLLTGKGPDDPEKRAMLGPNWQPYSIKVGDTYYSYANIAPFMVALAGGAAISEARRYAKPDESDPFSVLLDAGLRTANVVTEMSVVAGLGAVVKSIQDPERYGPQWLTTTLQGLVPMGSALNTLGQAEDPFMRRADVGEPFLSKAAQGAQARVPNIVGRATGDLVPTREDVPIALDPLGRPISNDQSGAAVAIPVRVNRAEDDPVMQAFLTAGVDIGQPKESLPLRQGASVAMTPAERRAWQQARGTSVIAIMADVQRDPTFTSAQPSVQAAALRRVLDAAGKQADAQLLQTIGESEITRRMKLAS